MVEYGEFRGLSDDVIIKIEKVKELLAQYSNEDISLYYGYPIIEMDGSTSIIKSCIVSSQGIIGLYEVEDEKMVYDRHFTGIIMGSKSLSPLFFDQKLVYESVNLSEVSRIKEILDRDPVFSHELYKETNGIIQNFYGLNSVDERELKRENSLGAIIKKRCNEMNMLDHNQFNGIYNSINSHMRIRGLAGSGKTILLVKKMAYEHFKNRELDLAYVFFTKSLKQYIEELFKKYYKDFEKYKEPDMSKIHILHAWGGQEVKGFYSEICDRNNLKCRNYMSAGSLKEASGDRFAAVCNEVLECTRKTGMVQLYNYIFVDEAQDFKLPFFIMAKNSLKFTGKLIYAYDELQSLNGSIAIPSKASIFGDEECEDVDLDTCYRTPKEILVTAHAFGLGIYKKDKDGNPDIVNMMEDYSIWKAVGYKEIDGTLGFGKHVVLDRQDVISYKPQQCVELMSVEEESKQYERITEEIYRLVSEEDVKLEDILIIDLAGLKLQDDFAEFRTVLREKQSDDIELKTHLVNKDNAIKFKRNGSITYTTIFRAKGNEANIVFVVNAHKMSSMASYSRNRLFTAMTRAKFKTYVLGVEGEVMDSLSAEYNKVKENGFRLEFTYPTREKLKQMQSIAKIESERVDAVEKVYKNIGNDSAVTIEVLKEQLGVTNIKELIALLGERSDE